MDCNPFCFGAETVMHLKNGVDSGSVWNLLSSNFVLRFVLRVEKLKPTI